MSMKKRMVKLWLYFLFILLLIIIFFGFKGSITGNVVLNFGDNLLQIPRLLIIGLLSLILILGIETVLGVETNEDNARKRSKNLIDILSKEEIDINDLVAVRAIFSGRTNMQRDKIYAGPFRPTIHFALNHVASVNPVYGKWGDADTFIITPFKDLIKKNKDSFYGGSTVDAFFVGYTRLPDNTVILKREKGESDIDFQKKAEAKIEQMGFRLLSGGDWAWGGSWEATEKFSRFLRKMGYHFGAHKDTEFEPAEKNARGFVFNGYVNKTLQRFYMAEIVDQKELAPRDYGARVTKKGEIKFPSLERFYSKLSKVRLLGEYPTFEEWQKIRLEETDVELNNKKYNSKLLRDLYADYLKQAVKSSEDYLERDVKNSKKILIQNVQALKEMKKKAKNDYKIRGKEGIESQTKIDIGQARSRYENQKREYESAVELSRL